MRIITEFLGENSFYSTKFPHIKHQLQLIKRLIASVDIGDQNNIVIFEEKTSNIFIPLLFTLSRTCLRAAG